jgi:hypothetical protein
MSLQNLNTRYGYLAHETYVEQDGSRTDHEYVIDHFNPITCDDKVPPGWYGRCRVQNDFGIGWVGPFDFEYEAETASTDPVSFQLWVDKCEQEAEYQNQRWEMF